ncbi:tyrosine-type recombinase/integrase [Bacillus pumilus]|uniref:tyrosine-type recombinase/integrase n=2 Tax=Bacillus pumilus TaxID=1408 RepID=UPI00017A5ED7|nr:tyrosine-type recombinase/integrase [Bacillus pumilus]EDW22343.1 site-specific recombinase, phage integrase family protein [Bacillus pumilus ATCC 7061]MDR4269063.1 tyrosine-type recombinase/integrase [Bacillus pumilus]MDR4269150.1 tyrosine-type recombinase/integrase [Bacillus pumilus]SNV11185.1 site-specific integrase [Bacillus pumilus]
MHSERRKGKRVKAERTITKTSRGKTYSISVICEKICEAKLAENRAPETIDRYRRACRYLLEYARMIGLDDDIRDIDVDFARGFVAYLLHERVKFDGHKFKKDEHKTPGMSPKSVNDYIKTLRTLFRFAQHEGSALLNPFDDTKLVSDPEEMVNILSPDELRRLLSAPDQRTFVGFRDYVIMTFLVDSMARIGEILSLTKENVDYASSTVYFSAWDVKTRQGRFVPLERKTMNLIKELLIENEDFESPFVFLSNYGEQLETNHFRKQLNRYAEQVGITKKVHPHLFRHTGATMYLENGGDIRHLQAMLGHRDMRMVKRYTHLSKSSLKEQHSKHSPLVQITEKLNKERKTFRKR